MNPEQLRELADQTERAAGVCYIENQDDDAHACERAAAYLREQADRQERVKPNVWELMQLADAMAARYAERDIPTGGLYRGIAEGHWQDSRKALQDAMRDACIAASPAAPVEGAMGPAARDVLDERRRQMETEGWTPEHDDEHTKGEMALAAACYAAHTATWSFIGSGLDSKSGMYRTHRYAQEFVGCMWPWARSWWKPSGPRRNLVKAGALILAEIERLDHAVAREETPQ